MVGALVATDILEQIKPQRFAGDVFRVMVNDYPPEKNTVVWLGRGGLLIPSARGTHKNLVIYPNTAGTYQFIATEIRRLSVG